MNDVSGILFSSNVKLIDWFSYLCWQKLSFLPKNSWKSFFPAVQITDLLVNITKHVLIPKHEVLTDRQKKNLLKKFNIEEKQVSWYNLEKHISDMNYVFLNCLCPGYGPFYSSFNFSMLHPQWTR